jgi:citrate lyase subunit beta/citryl-CoA lyase
MSALDDLRSAWRTYAPATILFTPGNDEHKIAKVGSFGSAAVVLDLEDAVAEDEKQAARAMARAGVEGLPDTGLRLIRVNNASTGFAEDDVCAIVGPALDGILYPKVEHVDELWDLDRWIGRQERECGLEVGRTAVIALIETTRSTWASSWVTTGRSSTTRGRASTSPPARTVLPRPSTDHG